MPQPQLQQKKLSSTMNMTAKTTDYICIREKQVNKHETDIAELKTKADFRNVQIAELKIEIDKIDKKLDKIDECLNQLKLQSERDDFNIDTRVTQLETTQNTLKWVVGIGLTCIGTAIAVLSFFLTIIH